MATGSLKTRAFIFSASQRIGRRNLDILVMMLACHCCGSFQPTVDERATAWTILKRPCPPLGSPNRGFWRYCPRVGHLSEPRVWVNRQGNTIRPDETNKAARLGRLHPYVLQASSGGYGYIKPTNHIHGACKRSSSNVTLPPRATQQGGVWRQSTAGFVTNVPEAQQGAFPTNHEHEPWRPLAESPFYIHAMASPVALVS